jgi:hypothetical protein
VKRSLSDAVPKKRTSWDFDGIYRLDPVIWRVVLALKELDNCTLTRGQDDFGL